MGFAGMDCKHYPGDAVMDALRTSTNLVWCGFYLAPAPYQPDSSWMDRQSYLASQGWGFAPIYVGRQEGSQHLTAKQGTTDGDNACALARAAGFDRCVIYLDLEAAGAVSEATGKYLAAWSDAVRALQFVPGVYCSHTSVRSIQDQDVDVVFWVYKFRNVDVGAIKEPPFRDGDPGESGADGAVVWQWAQNCVVETPQGNLEVDLDTAAREDPSRV